MAAEGPIPKISVTRAIIAGTLFVNGPVMALILSPLLLVDRAVAAHIITPDQKWMVVPAFLCGIGLAWTWWSFTIARWRIWAFERVEDIPALKEAAVTAGLTWPEGSAFSRTEIKSKAQAQKERSLDERAERLDFYGLDEVVARTAFDRALVMANGRRTVKITLSPETAAWLGLDGTASGYNGIPLHMRDGMPLGEIELVTKAV